MDTGEVFLVLFDIAIHCCRDSYTVRGGSCAVGDDVVFILVVDQFLVVVRHCVEWNYPVSRVEGGARDGRRESCSQEETNLWRSQEGNDLVDC